MAQFRRRSFKFEKIEGRRINGDKRRERERELCCNKTAKSCGVRERCKGVRRCLRRSVHRQLVPSSCKRGGVSRNREIAQGCTRFSDVYRWNIARKGAQWLRARPPGACPVPPSRQATPLESTNPQDPTPKGPPMHLNS